MELYIPPPTTFLPRLPPPRPAAPPVPVVPIPELPDVIHAPEGAYTLNKEFFPSTGTPVAPLPYDHRPLPSTAATMLGGAGGFIIAPPPPNAPPPGQTAMSFGTTVVNGQAQPAHPVRFSWVNVYFPHKPVQGERGFGAMLGKGGKEAPVTPSQTQQPTTMPGYEPSVSSDSEPSTADLPPIPIMEVPLTALPNMGASRKNPFGRASAVAPNTLAALPRPKTSLRSSNSTFVTRLQAADNLPKIIAERGRGQGEWARWGFWNLGRTFGWGEEGGKHKDPFARVTFSQVPTCHAVSHITAGPERIDIIIGFTSGDIVWLDFLAGKYSRINKGGLLNNTSVTSINFHPLQPHHFIASFTDGVVMQFNLFAEDPVTTINTAPMPWAAAFEKHDANGADVANGAGGSISASISTSRAGGSTSGLAGATANGSVSGSFANGVVQPGTGSVSSATDASSGGVGLSPTDPVSASTPTTSGTHASVPNGAAAVGADAAAAAGAGTATPLGPPLFEDSFTLWKNGDWEQLKGVRERAAAKKKGAPEEVVSPWAGKNPVAAFKAGGTWVKSAGYSPDGRTLALASEDGMLRLLDTSEERLIDTFAGYYASLNCLAWSPDSRFVAVGGQDDLIAIYSPRESRLVARCQGHSAFVTCIAFDPTIRTGGYRFASVGEDAKLVLWDFTAAALHRPRHHVHHSNASHHRISAMGSTVSFGKSGEGAGGGVADGHHNNPHAASSSGPAGPRFHPAPPRSEVALLQPVFARVVEGNLLTGVHVGPAAIVTVSRAAGVRFWMRPPRVHVRAGRGKVGAGAVSPGGKVAGFAVRKEGVVGA